MSSGKIAEIGKISTKKRGGMGLPSKAKVKRIKSGLNKQFLKTRYYWAYMINCVKSFKFGLKAVSEAFKTDLNKTCKKTEKWQKSEMPFSK